MCLICVDFQKGRMNLRDARRAVGEMREKIGDEHAREVVEMLDDAARAAKETTTDDD
jgi:nicotinamidase-related amidase